MKIFGDNNEVLNEVVLCLTQDEAKELSASIAILANNPEMHHHHVCSEDHKTEITVSVYTNNNIKEFHPDFRKILHDDLGAD